MSKQRKQHGQADRLPYIERDYLHAVLISAPANLSLAELKHADRQAYEACCESLLAD